jgi:hypothetical protein
MGVFVIGGERVPVCNEEEALVLVLQPHPVLQNAMIVTKMQSAGRAHAGKHPLIRLATAQSSTFVTNTRAL